METKKEYSNDDLKKCVEIAKKRGYKVFTWERSSKYITQIFIENQKGEIGSVHEHFGGIRFLTIHKPSHNNGTGFGDLIKGEEFNNPEDLDVCFINTPYWFKGGGGAIKKYKNFDEHINTPINKILKYYNL